MNTIWSGFVTLMFFLPFAFGPAAGPQPAPGCDVCCPQGVCEPCPPDCCDDRGDCCEAPAPGDRCDAGNCCPR
jgi:hypothetical protein